MSIEDVSFWTHEAVKYTDALIKSMKGASGE